MTIALTFAKFFLSAQARTQQPPVAAPPSRERGGFDATHEAAATVIQRRARGMYARKEVEAKRKGLHDVFGDIHCDLTSGRPAIITIFRY